MSRLRPILSCFLAIVLIAGQVATGAGALAMVPGGPAAMVSGEMSGDCHDCADSGSDPTLCPESCCASCSTPAALPPVQDVERSALFGPRLEQAGRTWPGLTVSPHLTPPRLVLS